MESTLGVNKLHEVGFIGAGGVLGGILGGLMGGGAGYFAPGVAGLAGSLFLLKPVPTPFKQLVGFGVGAYLTYKFGPELAEKGLYFGIATVGVIGAFAGAGIYQLSMSIDPDAVDKEISDLEEMVVDLEFGRTLDPSNEAKAPYREEKSE